ASESRNDAGSTHAPHDAGSAGAPGTPDASGAPTGQDAEFNAGPSYLQIDMLHVPEVHAMGLHGEGVLVCVLDSGFELDHEALRQLEVRGQRDFVNGDDDPSYDPRTDQPTQSSHGTSVLSTIAGFAPGKLIGPAYRAEYPSARRKESAWELPSRGASWARASGGPGAKGAAV